MVDFLSFLVLIGLIGQSAIGLGYLVSSIWEQEKRASFFAGVQFLAMAGALILFIYWWASGFLATAAGIGIVICHPQNTRQSKSARRRQRLYYRRCKTI
jgi:hypothetical protein